MIAGLPMYDFPALRSAHDAFWAALAAHLVERGVKDVPRRLTYDLSHRETWAHPSLLLGQACEYPLAKSYSDTLTLVATPHYSAPGCEGARYRSAIIVRTDEPAESLAGLRNRRCVINEPDSNSGMNLLRAAVAPLAGGAAFFQSIKVSGSHRRSLESVAIGEADVAAIDCVTFAHLKRFEPTLTEKVRVLSWTALSPGLPFVTSRHTDLSTIEALRAALAAAIEEPSLAEAREQLLLEGIDLAPDAELHQVRALEHEAARLQYPTLC